jgi:ABC-2 type transport system permease protein
MSSFSKRAIFLTILALITACVILFASNLTSGIHEAQRKVNAAATREPQAADPAQAFVEITFDPSPMAQLSSGLTGIAPSVHFVRLGSARPMASVESLEHPSRRRWGRIDFSFAFLIYLPIALIPLAFVIYRSCTQLGDIDKLLAGRTTLLDFSIERVLLPLLGSAGFVGLVSLACLYSVGFRLGTNDMLARVAVWALLIGLYLLGWVLFYTYLLLRVRSFAVATIYYSAAFVLIAVLLPQAFQTFSFALERPRGRLPVIVERRKLAHQIRRDDRASIDRYLEREGYARLDWSTPLTAPQFAAIENARIEQQLQPQIEEFERSVQRTDQIATSFSWLSPYLVAQVGIDDLAGTGLARYSGFRSAAIAFHEQWRKYVLGFLARREFLDFDSLKAAPHFRFNGDDTGEILPGALLRCAYLTALCLFLTLSIRRRLKLLLPKRK